MYHALQLMAASIIAQGMSRQVVEKAEKAV
jgi:hypothetical protein